jgi:hypothetical protein
MTENKTKPTDASVEQYLAAIEDDLRRKDCETLVKIMAKATKQKPKMWGTAIVGFGTHNYKYESGREGETCLVGFSSRKGDISIYGTGSAPTQQDLLAKLGKHKMGKGCLYVGTLKDVDATVLAQLISESVKAKTN